MPKSKITKAEFDALEPETKKGYELVGESAYFTGEIPDVSTLETALANERALHQRATEALKPFHGLDPVKAREALAAQTKPADQNLDKLPPEVRTVIEQMRSDFEEKLKAKEDQEISLKMDRTIESALTKVGVIPEALPQAVEAVRKLVKPIGDDPTLLGVLGPTGTFISTPFEQWTGADLKKNMSWFFVDNGAGGTGSKGNTGRTDTTGAVVKVDREASKTNPALYRQAKEQAEKTGASLDLGVDAA